MSTNDNNHPQMEDYKVEVVKGRYQPEFKLLVVYFAKKHGVATVAKHFRLCRTTVYGWMKLDLVQIQIEQDCFGPKGVLVGPSHPSFFALEEEMAAWIVNKECQVWRRLLSTKAIREKAMELNETIFKLPDFSASSSWLRKFSKRYNLRILA